MCLYLRNANNPFSYQTNPNVNALTLVADMVEIVGLNSKPVALETGSVVERLVWESQDEIARSGGFKNLVSGTDTAAYLPFMALPRLSDWVVSRYCLTALFSNHISNAGWRKTPSVKVRCIYTTLASIT